MSYTIGEYSSLAFSLLYWFSVILQRSVNEISKQRAYLNIEEGGSEIHFDLLLHFLHKVAKSLKGVAGYDNPALAVDHT